MQGVCMKAAELFVKALENEGIEYIFGIPGEENLDFLEALRKSKIRLIVTRHEQAAGFMAATIGRLTGVPGVCLSTLGPGATNLVTAAAYANLGAMPMVMITGQKPITVAKQGRFQILDVIDMMRPITKYTKQIVNGNNIPSRVREAFRIACEERPGTAHLELPEDIASEEVEEHLFDVQVSRRPVADEEAINQAITMIHQASLPLLLIGAGANRKRTCVSLHAFIEKSGIPFCNTQMGKGVVDERHPLFIGTAALSQDDYIHCAIDRSDLIINVGHDTIEKPPFIMKRDHKKVIHVNFSPAEIDEVYFPQLDVIGDISLSVDQLTKRIKPQSHWNKTFFLKTKEELDQYIMNKSTDTRFPLIPQRIVRVVRESMPADGIVSLDNGMYKIWFARNYLCYESNTLLLDNALASMGAGLPQAIATKLLFPTKKVLAVCGDGGFMMSSHELETAIRLNLDLVLIILNDHAYGMIKWKQESMGFKNFGLEFNNPDFVKFAESYGAKGYSIKSCAEFEKCLETSLKTKGVHVIDVAIDYSENNRVLYEELKEKTCHFLL